ncbi:hypothetical protein [Streptomyces millisiae]|uniref:Integral membrane protein n=1 Tax=Streptomyces millisiae TaxID=3075542 RepID=A0ABU2LX51_9ACTN|nr:hypothetical protein [Streptomyces sp. DSM 44918]MDT0322185.1 hypothetical protein [Streptomyces sp. DSM 44918]
MSALAFTTTPATPELRLRRWLALDAVVTGGNALAYLAAAGPVGRLLGLDTALIAGVGAFLLLFAAGVGWLASRPEPPVTAVRCVIEANAAWAVTSLAAVVLWLGPSTAGAVWIPAQALVVAALAAAQYAALRAVPR